MVTRLSTNWTPLTLVSLMWPNWWTSFSPSQAAIAVRQLQGQSLSWHSYLTSTYKTVWIKLCNDVLPCVPKKRPPFYFLNNSVKNWPILIIFGVLNLEKISHEYLRICPPHLSDVATLPWEIQKVIFNIVIHILQIIYVTSEENE